VQTPSKTIAKAQPEQFLIYVPAARMNFRAPDRDAAVAALCEWRDLEGYGASDIGAEFPLYLTDASGTRRQRIGTVYYNGRVELTVPRQNQGSRIAAARRRKALTQAGTQ
jgi:hypothetical protein